MAAPATATLLQQARPSNDLISKINQQLQTIYNKNPFEKRANDSDEICALLLTYPLHTVTAIHNYLNQNIDMEDYDETHERNSLLKMLTQNKHPDNAQTIHDYLALRADSTLTARNLPIDIAMVRALRDYPQLPNTHYTTLSKETKTKIKALLNTTREIIAIHNNRVHNSQWGNASHIGTANETSLEHIPSDFGLPLETEQRKAIRNLRHEDNTRIRLTSDIIINLILDQPDNAPAITAHIRKGINDPELLQDIFTSTNPALRNGLL